MSAFEDMRNADAFGSIDEWRLLFLYYGSNVRYHAWS